MYITYEYIYYFKEKDLHWKYKYSICMRQTKYALDFLMISYMY